MAKDNSKWGMTAQGKLILIPPVDVSVRWLQAVKRLDQALVGLLVVGSLATAAALLAVAPLAGWDVYGVFLQARVVLGLVGAGLLYLRRPVQAFRQRFFSAEGVIG